MEIIIMLEHAWLIYVTLYLFIGGIVGLTLHSANTEMENYVPLITVIWPITIAVIVFAKLMHRKRMVS